MINPKLKLLGLVATFLILFSFRTAFAADIIIDDGDTGYSETGPPGFWNTAVNSCGFNGDYRYETDVGSTQFAEWVPTLPAAGAYRVYVHYCVHSARPDAVVYRIVNANGTAATTVDQTKNANGATVPDFTASGWKYIGTFNFTPSSGHKVEVDTSDPGDTVADAVRFSPDLIVPDDFPKIQGAIDAAAPGATILVNSGTYTEDLKIPTSKTNLNLVGFSATIKGIQNVPIASSPLAVPNIEILANGVKIHSFTIKGPDYEAGKYSSGMVIGSMNVNIFSNKFEVTPAATSGEISQAIQTYHKLAIPGVNISGLNIHDNTFTHLSSGAAGYEGIWINLDEGTGTARVEDNKFTGNVLRAITTERFKTIIDHNTIITDLAPGFFGSGGWQGINVGGANSGAISTITVTNNIINGSSSGKGFVAGVKAGYDGSSSFNGVTISKNTIQNNVIGIWTRFTANGIVANLNNIFGNLEGAHNNDTVNTLNARFNWWGNSTGPFHATFNPTGLGDPVSDNVDFKPWLSVPFIHVDKTKPKVQSILINTSQPITPGDVNFIVMFNQDMNTSVDLTVYLSSTKFTIPPVPEFSKGWLNTTTWRGQARINESFPGDGNHKLTVKDGKDFNGNLMVTNVSTFSFDTLSPQFFSTKVSDIYSGDSLTAVAQVFDPGSFGIKNVTIQVDFTNYTMTFSSSEKLKVEKTRENVSTFFSNVISGLGLGPHNAKFFVYDFAGNANVSSTLPFTVLSALGSPSGTIAFLCKNDPVVIDLVTTCNEGIERYLIEWLRTKGWTVDVNKYSTWTTSQLLGRDKMMCSDQLKACRLNEGIISVHKNGGKPFIEVSDAASSNAAFKFDYISSSGASSRSPTVNIFIDNPDIITAGKFGPTIILNNPQRLYSIFHSRLGPYVKDLADADDKNTGTNFFKLESSGSQGKFLYVGWFQGVSSSKGRFTGWIPQNLTATGETLLTRAIQWAS